MPKAHSAPLNATVSKVASGALEQIPVVIISNVVRFIEAIQARGVWVLGTQAGGKMLSAVDVGRPICWVMGPEGTGLKRLTLEACDEIVGIPLQPGMASLNVSVATGICLYETARQRHD
jgi:23S rRNA (guanosine2251-2'-O)-methyltransferase